MGRLYDRVSQHAGTPNSASGEPAKLTKAEMLAYHALVGGTGPVLDKANKDAALTRAEIIFGGLPADTVSVIDRCGAC